MRVMVLVKASKESERGVLPSEKLLAAMSEYNAELAKNGVLLAGEGLKPSAKGKRITFQGSRRMVEDGPFGPAKDLVSGFWLWKVQSLDQAVELLGRCPDIGEGAEVEIRPLQEPEDLAASDPSGSLRQREEQLRKNLESRAR